MFESVVRRPKNGKRSRPEDEDTYVLSIEIVPENGGTRHTSNAIPTLALFNSSSDHSWISKRFAEKLGIIPNLGENSQQFQPIKLAWKSKGLGRYTHRTVFMVAPYANFNLLFAEMQDENKRSWDPTIFQKGIQRGHLKRLVKDEHALRVVPGTSDNIGPTLAQLEAQLYQDNEGHKSYHIMDACNTRSTHLYHKCSLENGACNSSGHQSASTLPVGSSEISFNPTENQNDYDLGMYSNKRPKRSPYEHDSSEWTDTRKKHNNQSSIRHKNPGKLHHHDGRKYGTTITSTSGADFQGQAFSRSLEGVAHHIRSNTESQTTEETTSSVDDLSDPDYWKWDEAEKRYYHIDTVTKEKLWYEAPP